MSRVKNESPERVDTPATGETSDRAVPTVSVVVAAYNEGTHIERLLRSLKAQRTHLLEVIVVDDGSTDATCALAMAAGARVVRTRHCGPAHARNVGALQARGDILVFLDGDMAAAPKFVERLIRPIVAGAAVGSFSRDIYIGDPTNRWSRAYAHIRRLAFPRLLPEDFPDRWENYRAVRRDAFISVGGYDDVGYGEDMTLAPKLGELAVVAPGAVCWHFNPDSPAEIYRNGRWIGRGYDIRNVAHPWRSNAPWYALAAALRDGRAGAGWRALVARAAYHAGVLIGLAQSRLRPGRHWK